MLNNIPEPWRSFLKEIDDSLLEEETAFHCIGGFVIAILYNFERETSDLDFISCIPRQNSEDLCRSAGEGSLLNKKYRVYLDPVRIVTPPENYEDRLIEMFPGEFKYLRLYALDPYDLALSKLERNMAHDREDVLYLAKTVPFDLTEFEQRYKEEFEVYIEDIPRHRSTFRLWMEMIQEQRENRS